MASFSAQLQVEGNVFRLQHCAFEVQQATHQRGRVSTKVRYGLVQVLLDVPDQQVLLAWAADPIKQLTVDIVFLDANGGSAVETLHLPAAYCVAYQEEFRQGDSAAGAYVCQLTLSDPVGWTIQAGGPVTGLVMPVAREHGNPLTGLAAAIPLAGAAGAQAITPVVLRTLVSPRDVPAHLPAPHPIPSPDHAQVHLTATEWQDLIKDRWDNSAKAKNKRFLKAQRQTEFQVEGDPFTYRTDRAGKMVAVYDAQRSYSITGSKNGLLGIPLTLNGQPTYAGTAHMFPVAEDQKNVVVIEMAGSRAGDFKRANEAAGLLDVVAGQGRKPEQAPKGYTWHHRDDFQPNSNPPPYGSCTMELVKTGAHEDTFVHFGSCDQCNKHFTTRIYE
jgi:hypothetical protein